MRQHQMPLNNKNRGLRGLTIDSRKENFMNMSKQSPQKGRTVPSKLFLFGFRNTISIIPPGPNPFTEGVHAGRDFKEASS